MQINNYKLDKYQMKVVKNNSKSLLVIAGAGSGKTLTLVGKIKYLIQNKKIKEHQILCLSFTNNAANNLKKTLKSNGINIETLTFHKLGLKIIGNIEIDIESLTETISKNLDINTVKEIFKNKLTTIPKGNNSNLIENEIIDKSNIRESLVNLIETFINLFKAQNYKIDKFKQFEESQLINLIKEIYIQYEINKSDRVDFNDMLIKAINQLKKGKKLGYKYIIVDEFQDTSLLKIELLQQIIKNDKSKIVAVGDDYQSIYRFTGCNLNIFLHFKKYFKRAKILKLKYTYRNSQELINISVNFVTKNKKQIKKTIVSSKSISKPIKIYYYNKSINEIIPFITEKIVYLSRNNKDIHQINTKINFMTIHKSKGLEFENVALFNLEDKINSLPSKIQDHHILKPLLNIEEFYPYEEERRLFYVALTRTKNYIYLLVKQDNPSIFVTEIIKDNIKYIEEFNKSC